MGHIFQRVRFQNPETGRTEAVVALVDSGASDTVIPAAMAGRLKLRKLGRLRVETAKGTMWVMESMCRIRVQGRARVLPVLVAPGPCKALIGVTTLESMGWNLDMIRRRLVRSRLLLYGLSPVA